MNKNKVSAQDIIDSLAAKADITKQLAEDFFKTLIASIEEALLTNDSVKIKNLGTFKLNRIAPRKSVNVQTGEDIIINGYYKVVFTPDKDLKELVNKPFAHLEPVVLDGEEKSVKDTDTNPLSSLTEQADEIKGLLSEIQSMSSSAQSIQETKEDTVEQATVAVREECIIAQEEVVKTELKEIKVEEKELKTERQEQRTAPQDVKTESRIINNDKPTLNTQDLHLPVVKKRRSGLWVGLSVLSVVGLIVLSYFIFMPVQHWVNKNLFGYDTAAYDAAREKSNLAEEWIRKTEETTVDEFQKAFDNRFENYEFFVEEEIRPGSRLAYLAEKYYDSPYFWVYIYEANMDRIPDPNNIRMGTVVNVPRVDNILIDLDNPRSIETALRLSDKYLE